VQKLAHYTLTACVACALVAGCSGGASTPLGPSAGPPDRIGSWMSPAATSQNLLYVSIQGFDELYVYSYLPPAVKMAGRLTGFSKPSGLCVDKSGDVYVANTGAKNLLVYAHGGTKPIAKLDDGNEAPISCSIDPSTGNLAVSGTSNSLGEGSIAIFKGARGAPAFHADPRLQYPNFLGYDDSGNLFFDGIYYYYRSSSCCFVEAYAELPKGAKRFRRIALAYGPGIGGIQWDGKYLAIGSGDSISEYEIAGSKGTRVRYTKLRGAHAVEEFWIHGSIVVGADDGYADVGLWRYPRGGRPTLTIQGLYGPFGATLSLKR